MKFLSILIAFILTLNSFSQTGGEDCATATIVPSLPYVGIGTTIGAGDDYYAYCKDNDNFSGSGDRVYEYIASTDIYVDISLCKAITNYNSQLYVYESDCTGTPVTCQEDGCQSPDFDQPLNSKITGQYFRANTTYYIIVDGFNSTSNGDYQINIDESIGFNLPESTNLPLVFIHTAGQDIVDEPKIMVDMKIIDNGPGEMNHPKDPANVYDGFAGIEIRGHHSATFPQKPFGIETRDSLGNNNNVSLLGMPEENDWILLSNYNDKVFFRNILAFDLFTKMGHYAPRTRLCEVVLDNSYNGIYVFTEKIKRDKNRVDISKLNEDENTGDDLTGGYIFGVDYWDETNSWLSNYNNPNFPISNVHFVYKYPDENDISSQQKTYIQNMVSAFEDVLWRDNFKDPVNGYRKYIDVPSFIDYFIVNEVARNVDGFKKSRNFYKDKDSKNPLIYAGPVWDFDWAFKDHNFTNGSGWSHDYSGESDIKPPGWYIRLMQDPWFVNNLNERYFTMRSTILNTATILDYIDSLGIQVADAKERHFARWPILGINVGTPELGTQPTTYAEELIKFKNWLEERLTWLDANIPSSTDSQSAPYFVIYPNPSTNLLNIYADESMKSVKIFDISGRLIKSYTNVISPFIEIDTTVFTGVYFVIITFENGEIIEAKLVSH